MIRFAVINEEEQERSKDEESVEIQAEKCLGIYEGAIRLLQKGQLDESRVMLKNLIDSDLMQKIDSDSEIAARGTPLRRLQYLVYTNYAYILEQVSDESSALQFYLKAIAFDNSDNSLWIRIGTIAAKEKRFKLARYSLECGLQQQVHDVADKPTENIMFSGDPSDQDLTPSQWSCLETLCDVLYKIGDFVACDEYIQKALRISPYFQRGLEIQDLIRRRILHTEDEPISESMSSQTSVVDTNVQGGAREIVLDELSWVSLGEQLLEEFKSLQATPGNRFYNQRLLVRTNSEDEEEEKEEQEVDEDVKMDEAPAVVDETTTVECEAVMEDVAMLDAKVSVEQPEQGHNDVSGVASDDLTEMTGEKEATETEQNAAMKRKRKEVEERSGLRTSKRVRDKLEQFEETKRKREEEEQEILAKYRIILSKFGLDIEHGYISGTTPASLPQEDVFPSGLSGLLVTFNKHLERPNALVQASTIEHVQQQKTNHFAIFNLEKNEPPTDSVFEDETALLNFINDTNEQNSGVVEYLCEFVMALLSRATGTESESNWQRRWPSGLRNVLSSIICVIEQQLLEYLDQESALDEDNEHIEQRIKVELQLSICEMFLDEMVHAILHPFTVVKKGRGARKVDAEHVARLDKTFQRWLYLAGLGLETPLRSFPNEPSITQSTIPWIRVAALRFNWMLGRHAQCLGNATEAISRFEDCVQQLKGDSSMKIELPNCKYDTKVDAERIHERLRRLKTHQYVLDSARLFAEKDYGAVMTRLEPIFLKSGATLRTPLATENEQSDITDTIGGSLSERLELMSLLYKSCEALENRTQQFQCITEMFVLVVETLVNTITDKSEATEVWFLFGQVAQTLLLLRETLQSTTLTDLLYHLENSLLQRLVCCVLAIARLGFVNVLHQDRLVDDDIKLSYLDLLKHRPHLEQFNLVLVRVWVVLLLLLPGWIQERLPLTETAGESDQPMAEPLPLEMQPLDIKNLNLDADTTQKVLSQPLTTNSSTALGLYTSPSRELYMELIALVHDDLGVDGQYPIEHSSETVDFDRKAAIEFFPLLERSLSDRVLRGQVRGDLKDAVDRVEEALGSPPYESNSILEMNRQLIDGYLASEIDFAEAIQVNSKNRLPTMQQPPSSKLPSVYRRIYAIQGKIFLAQYRNKAKSNQFKPLEDLQHAIDQFQTDIHVNPDSWDSWYSLATCYAFLADENLVFSALDIKNNYSKITDLQRKAFHCFSHAVRLAPKKASRSAINGTAAATSSDGQPAKRDMDKCVSEPSQESQEEERAKSEDRDLEVSIEPNCNVRHKDSDTNVDREWYRHQAAFWFDFGYLIHGIMSKPMRMEAMHRTGGLEIMSDTGDLVTIPIPEPNEEQVYKFAAFCLKRSLMLNDQNWRTPLMLGKCIEKLKGKPMQVLTLYRMAADLVPHRNGQQGNEKIFDAAYKIISTLSKYLAEDTIQPSVVESIMSKALAKSKLIAADGESFIFEPPEEYLQIIQSDLPIEEETQRKQKQHAFRLLCEGLARIRHTDKRHWHHRPVFRQAWILYSVYHDVERAKTEMLGLFQFKSNAKTLVSSVWKPEFERSGKHFIYVGEYTRFLIVLAKETNDVETLNSLARKIRRAQSQLLDLKEIWELLYDSYLAVLADLVGPDPVVAVAEVIPRTEFREKAAIYEAKMFEQASRLPGLTVLQRLCELKKLNEKMAAEGQMGRLLAVCYSKLFIEVGGADLYPKELVRQLSSTTEPSAVSSISNSSDGQAESNGMMVEGLEDGTASNKRAQIADEEDDQESARVKMAKLVTNTQGDEAQGSIDAIILSSVATGDTLPTIVIQGQESKESEAQEAGQGEERRADAAQPSFTNNMEISVPSSTDMPSSPAPSVNANDGEGGSEEAGGGSSNMDVEPDIEDWKTRKKISAAELASRATVMCKAPPPLLKAPQSLQSKLAGQDRELAQDETAAGAAGTGEVTAEADTTAVSKPQNDESSDITMSEATEKEAMTSTNDDAPEQSPEDSEGTGSSGNDQGATEMEVEALAEVNLEDHTKVGEPDNDGEEDEDEDEQDQEEAG
ncbi:Histone transcription regulator 3 [Dissophora globulifera]|nr:Histone transcription regulator 3 [Dissophora globulifera]